MGPTSSSNNHLKRDDPTGLIAVYDGTDHDVWPRLATLEAPNKGNADIFFGEGLYIRCRKVDRIVIWNIDLAHRFMFPRRVLNVAEAIK